MYARTAWGLIAEPGDSRLWRWLGDVGPEEALARLRSPLSPRRLASQLAHLMDPDEDVVGALAQWRTHDNPGRVEASVSRAARLGLVVLGPEDALWPRGLLDLGEFAPHTLWIRGDPALASSTSPWVAIVGSRRASGAGVAATRALVGSSWAQGAGVVSGGALGIDAAAHSAALARGIPTLAVLAGGLDSLYPAANAELFGSIAQAGALVAESPCVHSALPQRFLSRNRVIAALADVVVVVEAAVRSGALNTAGHAAALGRPTAVVPSRWGDPLGAGCWTIVRERHGMVLSEPEDVSLLLSDSQWATARRPSDAGAARV